MDMDVDVIKQKKWSKNGIKNECKKRKGAREC